MVTTGRNGGYVQRAYVVRNGNTYVSRTYVVNNVTYTSVYRSYSFGGYCCYYGYAPAYYWHPVYYGWAYNPWLGMDGCAVVRILRTLLLRALSGVSIGGVLDHGLDDCGQLAGLV